MKMEAPMNVPSLDEMEVKEGHLIKEQRELVDQIEFKLAEGYGPSNRIFLNRTGVMIFTGGLLRKETLSTEDLFVNIDSAAGPGGIDSTTKDSMLAAVEDQDIKSKIDRILEIKPELEQLKQQIKQIRENSN